MQEKIRIERRESTFVAFYRDKIYNTFSQNRYCCGFGTCHFESEDDPTSVITIYFSGNKSGVIAFSRNKKHRKEEEKVVGCWDISEIEIDDSVLFDIRSRLI